MNKTVERGSYELCHFQRRVFAYQAQPTLWTNQTTGNADVRYLMVLNENGELPPPRYHRFLPPGSVAINVIDDIAPPNPLSSPYDLGIIA